MFEVSTIDPKVFALIQISWNNYTVTNLLPSGVYKRQQVWLVRAPVSTFEAFGYTEII